MNEKCLNDQTTQVAVSTIQALNSDVVVEVDKLNTINEEIPAITCEMQLPSASYFSRRTLTVVHEAVEELGGHMIGAYVAYDGAKERDPSVMSLYRYYDHYAILGRRKDEK